MSVEKTHERCAICDWLGREAERTAKEQGTGHWSSYDGQRDGTEHAAHYLAEVGLTANTTEKENTMEHCDFCETTVESVSTGGGVGICADCRGEAEVSR